MRIPDKKISCSLLLIALAGLFADKFIPHSHQHDGFGVMVDFSSGAVPGDPNENQEAGEKIHSEFWQKSEHATVSLSDVSGNQNETQLDHDSDLPVPEAPDIPLRKYLLLQKVLNQNHRWIKYFTFKAPPAINVRIIHDKNQNIYRRSIDEKNSGNQTARV